MKYLDVSGAGLSFFLAVLFFIINDFFWSAVAVVVGLGFVWEVIRNLKD